jgi:hypothetical protein
MDEQILENEEKEVEMDTVQETEEIEEAQPEAIENNDESDGSTLENTPPAEEKSDTEDITKKENDTSLENELSRLRLELETERQKRIETEGKIMAIDILEKRGLPRSLSEIIASSSYEESERRADIIAEIIRGTVNDEVAKRLSTLPMPQRGKESLTKGSFKGMSLDEMQRLYKSDKTLYLELAKK